MLLHPAPLAATVCAVRGGRRDIRDVIDEACDLIDAHDGVVQAILPEPDRRTRLHAEADALAARYPDSGSRPPLFGALLGVKDIFHADGFVTRAGATLPPELWQGAEAASVSALKDAGALVLGKTVTTEFAFYEPGPTRNPHAPGHTPGGSSSGSAAAVAAGFCHVALGSQTIGSMIRPAAFCGIAGFKPTYGRIDVSGVLPFSESADHIGVFTQDAAGLALAASLLCADWAAGDAIDRPVLGVPEGPYLDQAPVEALDAFEGQVARLARAGYVVRRARVMDDIDAINIRHRRMAAAELAQVHREWFAAYAEGYRPRTAEMIQLGQSVSDDELAAAREGRWRLRDALCERMNESGVDVWVSPPTLGPAPEGLASTGDPIMNLPWTHAGLPTMTLPAGTAEGGLPLGLQCTAGWAGDERLLGCAEDLARALD